MLVSPRWRVKGEFLFLLKQAAIGYTTRLSQQCPPGLGSMSYALEIEGLEKVYANGLQALKGIDLRVAQGDFFALLGPNGAGKSTTIGVICSLVNKTAGTVRVNGVDIDEDFPRAKRHLGVVPQEFNFNVFESVEDILIHLSLIHI